MGHRGQALSTTLWHAGAGNRHARCSQLADRSSGPAPRLRVGRLYGPSTLVRLFRLSLAVAPRRSAGILDRRFRSSTMTGCAERSCRSPRADTCACRRATAWSRRRLPPASVAMSGRAEATAEATRTLSSEARSFGSRSKRRPCPGRVVGAGGGSCGGFSWEPSRHRAGHGWERCGPQRRSVRRLIARVAQEERCAVGSHLIELSAIVRRNGELESAWRTPRFGASDGGAQPGR